MSKSTGTIVTRDVQRWREEEMSGKKLGLEKRRRVGKESRGRSCA